MCLEKLLNVPRKIMPDYLKHFFNFSLLSVWFSNVCFFAQKNRLKNLFLQWKNFLSDLESFFEYKSVCRKVYRSFLYVIYINCPHLFLIFPCECVALIVKCFFVQKKEKKDNLILAKGEFFKVMYGRKRFF